MFLINITQVTRIEDKINIVEEKANHDSYIIKSFFNKKLSKIVVINSNSKIYFQHKYQYMLENKKIKTKIVYLANDSVIPYTVFPSSTPVRRLKGTREPSRHPGRTAGKARTKSMHFTLNSL